MAANIARGEFEVEFDGQMLVFKQTMTPSRISQDRAKKTIGELYLSAGRNDVNAIRELTWMLLQAYHADRFKNLDDADALFNYYGGPRPFFGYLSAIGEFEESQKSPGEGVAPGNP